MLFKYHNILDFLYIKCILEKRLFGRYSYQEDYQRTPASFPSFNMNTHPRNLQHHKDIRGQFLFSSWSYKEISYQDYQRTKEDASLLPILQHEFTSSESSASLRILEDALYSLVGAKNRVTGALEQLFISRLRVGSCNKDT